MPDALLVLYLLIYVPGRQLWASIQKKKTSIHKTRLQRYRKTIAETSLLLLVVILVSVLSSHSPAALGFDIPVSRVGEWGLLFAVLFLLSLIAVDALMKKNMSEEKLARDLERLKSDDMLPLPRTSVELWTFTAFCLVIGCSWEILYRGFLLLVLSPITGISGAVVLSAIGYGAAHGYTNPKQFMLSIVSAFIFTIAFAATHSLWWLMLIHVGLPMIGAFSCFKMLSAPDPLTETAST